jgi:hypothetical protein
MAAGASNRTPYVDAVHTMDAVRLVIATEEPSWTNVCPVNIHA